MKDRADLDFFLRRCRVKVIALEWLLASCPPVRFDGRIQSGQVGRRGLFDLIHFKVPLVRIRLEMRAIGVERTTANQIVLNSLLNNPVQDALLNVRPDKPATTVLRQRRGIRHLLRQTKAKKPAVGHFELDFLDQPSLGANPEQVAIEQHPQQHHQINRRLAIDLAVQVRYHRADEIKPDVLVEQAEQVLFRNQLFQRRHIQFGWAG